MIKQILTILLSIASMTAIAKKTSTIDTMHDALNSLTNLLPYMTSHLKFSDPRFEKEIEKELIKMKISFVQAKHNKDLKTPTFLPSYELLVKSLDDSLTHFQSQNKAFARLKINEMTYLCLSCHTQIPQDKVTSFILNDKKLTTLLKDDQVQLSQLYFILRNYSKSLEYINKYIFVKLNKREGVSKHFDKKLYRSIYQSLLIYLKVQRAPDKANQFLTKIAKYKNTPEYLTTEIKNWKKQITPWIKHQRILSKLDLEAKEVTTIIQEIEKHMKKTQGVLVQGDYDIDLMIISGVLANQVMQNPKRKNLESHLYWMGIAENKISKNILYSLGHYYLKSCIQIKSKNPIRKKCYQQLEDDIKFKYTGSQGENIPEEILKELKSLKKLL